MTTSQSSAGMQTVKCLLIGFILLLSGLAVHAGVDKAVGLTSGTMMLINQLIKAAAVFFACILALHGERILLRSMVCGLLLLTLSALFFRLLRGEPVFTLSMLQEALFGLALGAVSGILSRMWKKN